MTNLYQASDYWLTKDKAWLAERKAKWQRLVGLLKMKSHYTGAEIRVFEQYFVKGDLKFRHHPEFSIPKTPDLNLVQQLVWHPSADQNVWQEVVKYNASEFDFFDPGYDFISSYTFCYLVAEECKSELEQSFFCQRESQLYDFMYKNATWLEFLTSDVRFSAKNTGLDRLFRSHYFLIRTIAGMFSAIKKCYPKDAIYFYNCLPRYAISSIAELYTSEHFATESSEERRWPGFLKDINTMAEFYVNKDNIISEQRLIVEEWNSQLEKSAPEWQALWQKCKQDALKNYKAPVHKPEQKEIKTDPAYVHNSGKKPKLKQSTPWPIELVALKQHLEQQGYPVTTTEADTNAILQQHFAERCVYFGSFIESMQLETEDYDKPYPAFTAPLQALCDIKGDAKLSYTRRGERITIKVNGERVGVADLEEPAEDDDTSAYFAAIIRLAQQWFPQQVFAYGYESLHLYILPTELVSWLEANGFTNSLNYFGGAPAEQPVAGLSLVFTGVFSAGSREEMEDEAEQLGAKVQKTVNSKTNYLVCGSKVGASKLAKAEALGVKVLSEAEYQAMSRQGE